MSGASRPVFPSKNSELVEVVNDLVTVWTPSPEDIGLDAARVLLIKNQASATDAAQTDMIAKRNAAEIATATFNDACRTLRQMGGAAVKTIDAFAVSSTKPASVWQAAGIPAPKDPSALPPPGQPRDLSASLNSLGELTLKWKCSNPRGVTGVTYQVMRGLNGATPTTLDLVGEKTFVDGTIPMGTSTVTYMIRARRAGRVGLPSSDFTVRFGVGGGGVFIASQGEGSTPTTTTKLAA